MQNQPNQHEIRANTGALEITPRETAALLRAFFNLAQKWELTDAECRILLGQPAPRTYARWKAGEGDMARVPHDTRQRLGILMGVHKGLRYAFRKPARGYAWIRKANRAFGGQSALERMLGGDVTDLAAVRGYLEAEIGGW